MTAASQSTMSEPAHRYAVYFAPAQGHPLWRAGCEWLGRDPTIGQPLTPPALPEVSTPWRYGFHATIKAPMRLADQGSQAQFLQAVADWAQQREAIELPALEVGLLGDFIAILPKLELPRDHDLHRLAADCVTSLDVWRAPLQPQELAYQTRAPLSPRQLGNVTRWGYAHVMDDWRFHLTLSNSVPVQSAPSTLALLARAQVAFAEALHVPMRCDAVSVFVEPNQGAPFLLLERYPLGPRHPD